jgi:hypothetical protein
MNREVHVRFWERFRGETPLYLLDEFFVKLFRLVFSPISSSHGWNAGGLFYNFDMKGWQDANYKSAW